MVDSTASVLRRNEHELEQEFHRRLKKRSIKQEKATRRTFNIISVKPGHLNLALDTFLDNI